MLQKKECRLEIKELLIWNFGFIHCTSFAKLTTVPCMFYVPNKHLLTLISTIPSLFAHTLNLRLPLPLPAHSGWPVKVTVGTGSWPTIGYYRHMASSIWPCCFLPPQSVSSPYSQSEFQVHEPFATLATQHALPVPMWPSAGMFSSLQCSPFTWKTHS